MADKVKEPEVSVLEEAKKKAAQAHTVWQPIYDKAREDLFFLSDNKYAQWDQGDASSREKAGKPVLTVDQLSQFVSQVSNDVRMNTPSINIVPYSGGADIETSEIYQGLIRNIEYESKADDAYDNGVDFAIKCSIGFLRIDHDFIDDKSFEQSLRINRIINPLSVLLDPNSIESDGSDAKCAFVIENISEEEFKDRFPKFEPSSFDIDDMSNTKDEEEYTVVEYFYIEETPINLVLDPETGEARELFEGEDGEGLTTRESKERTVRRYMLSGEDVLEESIFPGEYIPIVPVYGKEAWEDGERHLHSLIRNSKDAQRMFNFWVTTEAELLMKQPKAPFIAQEGTMEDYIEDYQNPDKAVVLRYKGVDVNGRPAAPPQITPPPQIPAGIVNARREATEDIKSTMGLYNAFMGQRSNETSGVAINARKQEGDRSVFHFTDNLIRSITQVGRILVSAIPFIYDTPRIVRIIGKEDTNDEVGINGMVVEGQERHYNLDSGKFSVKVETGASYSTMRQEAAEFFQQIAQSQPALMQVMGDLMFKNMDFPGSQAMAERMKRMIDPKLLDDEADPAVAAMQAQNQELQGVLQQMQAEMGKLQEQLNNKQAELQIKMQAEQNDVTADNQKNQIEIAKLQLEEQRIIFEMDLKRKDMELRGREIAIKEREADTELLQTQLKGVEQLSSDINEGTIL